MKFLRFRINDDSWNWYLVPEDDKTLMDNHDAEAEVDFENHEVHIGEEHLNLITVLHELYHIHCHYTFTQSVNFSKDDMEEVGAELFSRRGEHIINQGKELLNKLTELKQEIEE